MAAVLQRVDVEFDLGRWTTLFVTFTGRRELLKMWPAELRFVTVDGVVKLAHVSL